MKSKGKNRLQAEGYRLKGGEGPYSLQPAAYGLLTTGY